HEQQYQPLNHIHAQASAHENVQLSWAHAAYLYHVVNDYLPPPALYMIRYHSFYPAHREGEYQHLTHGRDKEMFEWVRAFNPYDLYTKSHERPNVEQLRLFYNELISEYFPTELRW